MKNPLPPEPIMRFLADRGTIGDHESQLVECFREWTARVDPQVADGFIAIADEINVKRKGSPQALATLLGRGANLGLDVTERMWRVAADPNAPDEFRCTYQLLLAMGFRGATREKGNLAEVVRLYHALRPRTTWTPPESSPVLADRPSRAPVQPRDLLLAALVLISLAAVCTVSAVASVASTVGGAS